MIQILRLIQLNAIFVKKDLNYLTISVSIPVQLATATSIINVKNALIITVKFVPPPTFVLPAIPHIFFF